MNTSIPETKWFFKVPFIVFASIFFFPSGLALLWMSGIKKSSKVVATIFISFYGLLLIVASFMPDTPEMIAERKRQDSLESVAKLNEQNSLENKTTSEPKVEKPKVDIKAPRIINSLDDVKLRFNEFASSNNIKFRINQLTIEEGEKMNTFTYDFNDNISWLGTINKSDNSVNEITMISRGDGTSLSGMQMVVMMLGVIATADPSIKPTDRGDILRRLGLLDNDKLSDKMSKNTIQNGIKYWVNISPEMGVWFGASVSGS